MYSKKNIEKYFSEILCQKFKIFLNEKFNLFYNKYFLTGKSRNDYSWKYRITLIRTGSYTNIEEILKYVILISTQDQ